MKLINTKLNHSNVKILNTGMVLIHKFIASNLEVFTEYCANDKILLAGSAIFLSSKLNNTLFYINTICKVIEGIINQKNKQKNKKEIINENIRNLNLKNIKDKICEFEELLLISINFDLNVDLPYNFLKKIRNSLQVKNINNSSKIFEILCFHINDSYIFPVCLFFDPVTITLACIKIMKQNFNINLNINEIKDLSSFQIDFDEINQCADTLSLLYNNKSSGNTNDKTSNSSCN